MRANEFPLTTLYPYCTISYEHVLRSTICWISNCSTSFRKWVPKTAVICEFSGDIHSTVFVGLLSLLCLSSVRIQWNHILFHMYSWLSVNCSLQIWRTWIHAFMDTIVEMKLTIGRDLEVIASRPRFVYIFLDIFTLYISLY